MTRAGRIQITNNRLTSAANPNAERNHRTIITFLAKLELALVRCLSVVAVNGKSFHLNTVVHAEQTVNDGAYRSTYVRENLIGWILRSARNMIFGIFDVQLVGI